MRTYHLSLRKSIKVIKTLKKLGYNEIPEQIANKEMNEELMVLIDKKLKTYNVIDHKALMQSYAKHTNIIKIQLTQLKNIKKWK